MHSQPKKKFVAGKKADYGSNFSWSKCVTSTNITPRHAPPLLHVDNVWVQRIRFHCPVGLTTMRPALGCISFSLRGSPLQADSQQHQVIERSPDRIFAGSGVNIRTKAGTKAGLANKLLHIQIHCTG